MKTKEIIAKQEEIIEHLKAYYDAQKSPAVKLIFPQWENHLNSLESDLASLKQDSPEKESSQSVGGSAEEYLKEYFKKKGADLDILRASERRFVHYAIEAMHEFAQSHQVEMPGDLTDAEILLESTTLTENSILPVRDGYSFMEGWKCCSKWFKSQIK